MKRLMSSLGRSLHLLLSLLKRLLQSVQRDLQVLVRIASEDHSEPARLSREERLALRVSHAHSAYGANNHLAVLVNVIVQLLLVLERVALHVLVQVDPAEVARRAGDDRDAVLAEERLRDVATLPHVLAQRLHVPLQVLLVVQHVRHHRLAHGGHLHEVRELREGTVHVGVLGPEKRNGSPPDRSPSTCPTAPSRRPSSRRPR